MNAIAAILAFAAAGAAGAAEREVLSVDPDASVVRFHVDHKLHQVDGASRSIEGKAVLEGDGRVLAMVRIPVASFDTGDANRDSHLRETLEAARHPYVVFKGVARLPAPPVAASETKAVLDGELDFHGVKRRVEVPVAVQRAQDGSVRVRGEMAISLEAYRVDRPSLLFVKLDDACTIRFELELRRSP